MCNGFSLVSSLGTTCRCLSVQPFQLLPLRIIPPPPIDTSILDELLMLRHCFFDFVVEHRFGCRTTEPGYAGGIGTIEMCLIYSLGVGQDIHSHTKRQNHPDQQKLNWKGVCSLMYQCPSGTNLLEFQYRNIHRTLTTNSPFKKLVFYN